MQWANPPIAEIDKVLHAERALRDVGKVTFEAPFADLPAGTFIVLSTEAFPDYYAGRSGATPASSYRQRQRLSSACLPLALPPALTVLERGCGPRLADHKMEVPSGMTAFSVLSADSEVFLGPRRMAQFGQFQTVAVTFRFAD